MKPFTDSYRPVVLVLLSIAGAFIYAKFGLFPLCVGIGFAIIAMRLHQLSEVAAFRPYEVIIGFDYATICEDFGLQSLPEQLAHQRSFTAISPTIFYRSANVANECKMMLGMLFYEDLPCVDLDWQPGPGSALGERPKVSFHPSLGGYELRIQVDPEWWKENRNNAAPDVRDLPMKSDGTITLAVLPNGYIPDHVRGWSGKVTISRRSFERRQGEWHAKLSKLGWHISEYAPYDIRHRYVHIYCLFY